MPLTEGAARRLVTQLEGQTSLTRKELWELVSNYQNLKQIRQMLLGRAIKTSRNGLSGRPMAPACKSCLKRRQRDRMKRRKAREHKEIKARSNATVVTVAFSRPTG